MDLHAGKPGHGVAQRGLGALGAQEDLEGLGVPSFLAGQGVLGVPVGLAGL